MACKNVTPAAAIRVGEAEAVGRLVAAGQLDPGADGQRQEQFEPGDVERERRDGEQGVGLADRQTLTKRAEEVGQGAVRDLTPFGLPVEPEV